MIQATDPTTVPHATLSHGLPSGASGEIPLDEIPAMADTFESDEVTKQTNALHM